MKSLALHFIMLVAPLGLFAEPKSDLLPPQKRAETLNLARTLLKITPKVVSEDAFAGMNPFDPLPPVIFGNETDAKATHAVPQVAVSDRDLLKKLAEEVTASGMMQLGDRTFLLVGKKKLKVGDRISVNSGGVAYELEVSAIDRTSFALRLKNEEITRPIKAPVKKP